MKLKRVGAVLAGAAMIGATVAGAAVTAEESANVPDRDFFIDPADGMNNSLIVVGSDAAAADVVSAAYVSSKIGQMAYYEEVTEDYETTEIVYQEEDMVENYVSGDDEDDEFDDYRAFMSTPASPVSWVVLPYECGTPEFGETFPVETATGASSNTPWWDYDVYFDAFSSMDEKGEENFLVDTGCSFESIAVDFSIRDVECSADMCIGCMAGCDQMGLYWHDANDNSTVDEGETYTYDELIDDSITLNDVTPMENLLDCQTYPNIYPRNYWGMPSQEEGICDPVGGIQYRSIVDGYGTEPTYIEWQGVVGPASEAYGVCEENEPEMVTLYCEPCDVFFLNKSYDALSFGTDENGYDYMFYGTPEWFNEEQVKVGETSPEYGEGWTITVNDLGIYENKAHVTITNPDGETNDYLTVIDTYTSQVPSEGEGDTKDGGAVNDSNTVYDREGDANEENDCLIFKEDTFDVFSLCGEEEVGNIEFEDGEAVFAVDFTKTMIGAAGTYVIEYDAYALNDYGVLREQIYPGACEADIDPAIKVGDLEWFFDIIPGDDVQDVDLDNNTELWDSGNPNFDASDKLTTYAGMSLSNLYDSAAMTDFISTLSLSGPVSPTGDYDEYAYDIDFKDTTVNGTDYSAKEVFQLWDAFIQRMSNYYATVPVDVTFNGGAVEEYNTLAFAHDDDGTYGPDQTSNGETYTQATLDSSNTAFAPCSPMLELWLATPVELAGLCDEELSVTLEDCEGNNYFTLDVTDTVHTDYQIDGEIELSRTEKVGETVTTHYVNLEPEALVKLDENIDTTMKQEYNLVLIGGPVANSIVQELVDLEKTTFEKWDTSEGDLQHIENAFADGKDVLIVAGKDRDATTTAALDLVNAL